MLILREGLKTVAEQYSLRGDVGDGRLGGDALHAGLFERPAHQPAHQFGHITLSLESGVGAVADFNGLFFVGGTFEFGLGHKLVQIPVAGNPDGVVEGLAVGILQEWDGEVRQDAQQRFDYVAVAGQCAKFIFQRRAPDQVEA